MRRVRSIAAITGSRADYGLLSGLLHDLRVASDFDLHVIVAGTHMSARFGRTIDEIRADGITPEAVVDMEPSGDGRCAVAQACGRGLSQIAESLDALRPDLALVLGDRFEILAASAAALLLNIPIAHIHGGEITEGAMDDSIRHAISKMAQIHFAAAKAYADRLIRMGEAPECVFNVGALAVDNLRRLKLLDRSELARDIGLPHDAPYLLVTYHPVTRRDGDDRDAVRAMLQALDAWSDIYLVFTGVNVDPGHELIRGLIESYVAKRGERARLCLSLGHRRYLSAVKHALAVVGNSSSGIIEAPALEVPTVNIGSRQAGRLRAASVIDCDEHQESIQAAIGRALDPRFRASVAGQALPYGGGEAASRIIAALRAIDRDTLGVKPFHEAVSH